MNKSKVQSPKSKVLWLALLAIFFVQLSGRGQFVTPGGGGSGGGTNIFNVNSNAIPSSVGGLGTNTVFTTVSNAAGQGIMITNDTANSINSPSNVIMNFFGAGSNNLPSIEFTGPKGFYGEMVMLTTHDDPNGAVTGGEFALEFRNRIAIIPNSFGDGDDNAIQVGGAGSKGYVYFNNATNTTAGLVTPSIPTYYANQYNSNGVIYNFQPGILGDYPTPGIVESHLHIFHDSGRGGDISISGMGDKNKIVDGIDMKLGSNNVASPPVMYTGIKFYSRLGLLTNIMNLDTNGLNLSGNLTLVSTNFTTLGSYLNVIGNNGSGGGIFDAVGNNVQVGVEGTTTEFEVGNNGNGGAANDNFFSNLHGGSGFPLGGVSIGSNDVAPSGVQLFVSGNGVSTLPTNNAAINVLSNFVCPFNAIVTNGTGQRVTFRSWPTFISVVATANTGTVTISPNVTNNGVGLPSPLVGLSIVNGLTNTVTQELTFGLGPGDTFWLGTNVSGANNGSRILFSNNCVFVSGN